MFGVEIMPRARDRVCGDGGHMVPQFFDKGDTISNAPHYFVIKNNAVV